MLTLNNIKEVFILFVSAVFLFPGQCFINIQSGLFLVSHEEWQSGPWTLLWAEPRETALCESASLSPPDTLPSGSSLSLPQCYQECKHDPDSFWAQTLQLLSISSKENVFFNVLYKALPVIIYSLPACSNSPRCLLHQLKVLHVLSHLWAHLCCSHFLKGSPNSSPHIPCLPWKFLFILQDPAPWNLLLPTRCLN